MLCIEFIFVSICWSKTIIVTFDSMFNPFPKQALGFTCLQYRSSEITVGKGEIARKGFLPFRRTVHHYH